MKKTVLRILRLTNGLPLRTPFAGKGVILAFHRVVKEAVSTHNGILEISTKKFEEYLLYIKKAGYVFISIDEIPQKLKENSVKKFAVVTFDDGYKDNYTLAFPILRKLNIPFTIYITTSFPDKMAVLWWYALEDLINKTSDIKTPSDELNNQIKQCSNSNELFSIIRSHILKLNKNNQADFLNQLFEQYHINIKNYTEKLTMNWQQIIELSNNQLCTIAAHTVSHQALSKIPLELAEREILLSKQIIEQKTGKKVLHFAYPFGSLNEINKDVAQIVEKNGFSTAVTTIVGNIYNEKINDLYFLPRFLICEQTSKFFINIILNGTYAYLTNGFSKKIKL